MIYEEAAGDGIVLKAENMRDAPKQKSGGVKQRRGQWRGGLRRKRQ